MRPLIYSQGRLHELPRDTLNGIPSDPSSLTGLVDDATIQRMRDEPARPLSWRPGADPAVADLVGDRFGDQVVTRSVDPLLAGVYAGSAATIGLRSAVPTLAAVLDRGARNLTEAVRGGAAAADRYSVFGAVDGGYAVLLDELVRRADFHWAQVAVERLERRGSGWDLVDDEGGGLARRRGAARRSGAAVGGDGRRRRTPHRRRGAANRGGVHCGGGAGAAGRHPGAGPFRCSGGHRRTLARQGDHAVVAQVGTAGKRRAGAAVVRPVRRRLARSVGDDDLLSWAADDLAAVFGVTDEPFDCRVHRWIDAMPQYGPGHGELVAELRAGLPSSLAVAGAYLDGIGVPACVAAATRAAASLVTTRVAR